MSVLDKYDYVSYINIITTTQEKYMPFTLSFRMSMAAGGSASIAAEETLITWSGQNGESYPSGSGSFTEIDISDGSSGGTGVFQMAADNKGNIAATGNDTNSSVGIEMFYSSDSGATWTNFFKQTYDKSNGSLNDWEYPQYGTFIDGLFFFVARRCILVGDPADDLTNPANWAFGDAGGTTNFYRQIYEAQLDGTRYLIMNGNDGSRRYTSISTGKDYTDNSNWTTETGTTSEDWTSQLVVPKAGATNGDETVVLLNTEEGYFYDWTSNGGEPFNITMSEQLSTKNPQRNFQREDGFWSAGASNLMHYMAGGTTPSVANYTSWTSVSLAGISGYSSDYLSDFITSHDSQTAAVCSNNFVAFAKNPKNVGGTDGWFIQDTNTFGFGSITTMTHSNGWFLIACGTSSSNRSIYRTRGWIGDVVTVTFDSSLAASPIEYINEPGETSATKNDRSLYNALNRALDMGELSGVVISYNGGTNNGTGVKIVNTAEEEVTNITISGASATATISTYVDN